MSCENDSRILQQNQNKKIKLQERDLHEQIYIIFSDYLKNDLNHDFYCFFKSLIISFKSNPPWVLKTGLKTIGEKGVVYRLYQKLR